MGGPAGAAVGAGIGTGIGYLVGKGEDLASEITNPTGANKGKSWWYRSVPFGNDSGAGNKFLRRPHTGMSIAPGVDVKDLDPQFAARLSALVGAVPGNLGKVTIISAYRTEAQQQALRDHPEGDNPVAQGRSQHQDGRAADIKTTAAALAFLREHAKEFGIKTITGDPNHFEMDRTVNIVISGLPPGYSATTAGRQAAAPSTVAVTQ
jgi:hypothetical protein